MQLQSPLDLLIGTSKEEQNFKIRTEDRETRKLKKELDYIKQQLKKEEDINSNNENNSPALIQTQITLDSFVN